MTKISDLLSEYGDSLEEVKKLLKGLPGIIQALPQGGINGQR